MLHYHILPDISNFPNVQDGNQKLDLVLWKRGMMVQTTWHDQRKRSEDVLIVRQLCAQNAANATSDYV